MRVSIMAGDLKALIKSVMGSVAGNSTLPVLRCVLLRAEGGSFTATATNLDTTITVEGAGRVHRDGAVLIQPRQSWTRDKETTTINLTTLLDGMDGDLLTLDVDDKHEITILYARGQAKLKGGDPEDFPIIPALPTQALRFTLPLDVVLDRATPIVPLTARDEHRPTLRCLNVAIYADRARASASDTFRLGRVSMPGAHHDGALPPDSVMIPATLVDAVRDAVPAELIKGLRSSKGEVAVPDVRFAVAENAAFVELDAVGLVASARLPTGTYPDLDRIIPTSVATRIVVEKADLVRSLKWVAPMVAAHHLRAVWLTITPDPVGPARIDVSTQVAEVGDARSELWGQLDGEASRILVRHEWLQDALDSIETGQASIGWNIIDGKPGAMLIESVGGETQHVLMPLTPKEIYGDR